MKVCATRLRRTYRYNLLGGFEYSGTIQDIRLDVIDVCIRKGVLEDPLCVRARVVRVGLDSIWVSTKFLAQKQGSLWALRKPLELLDSSQRRTSITPLMMHSGHAAIRGCRLAPLESNAGNEIGLVTLTHSEV